MNCNQFCSLIIPGQLPVQNFNQINDMLVYDLENASNVSQITLYLTQQLPDQIAAVLNYSLPPFNDLQFIGAIANSRPSDTFSTKFGLNPDIIAFTEQNQSIKLIIKFEALENIRNIVELSQQNDLNILYAKKVAQNLFNFMQSYQCDNMQNKDLSQHMVIPNNFLEKWYCKFEQKYKRDPNFIMNTKFE